jgi:hypothetical protein
MAIGTLTALALGGAALGGIVSSSNNKSAANTATAASTAATNQSNALARETRDINTATFAPFVAQGGVATSYINQLLGIAQPQGQGQPGNAALAPGAASAGFDAYKDFAGFNDSLITGRRGIVNNQAVGGMLNSGGTLKALRRFDVGLDRQFAGDYLNTLLGQQGVGATAASAQAGVASNYSNQVQQNTAQNASNIGNAALARAGNNNQFLSGILNAGAYALGGR